jgi:hypothetical protein
MSTPFTGNQTPEKSILDVFNRQAYLGNQFTIVLDSEAVTNTETPIFYKLNPAALTNTFPNASKAMFHCSRRTSSTSGNVILRYYFNPTVVSNGTPITPINIRPSSANVSIAHCFTGTTVSSKGTLISSIQSTTSEYLDNNLVYIIDPGQATLITAQTVTGTSVSFFEMVWYEL